MKSNDILVHEHDNILIMLKVMKAFSDKSVAENSLDTKIAENIMDFVRHYADKFHHAKEEDLLFKEIEANAPGQLMGPVNVMLKEHDDGRNFIKDVNAGIEKYKNGDLRGLSRMADGFKGFANLLHDHIYKENNILYPAAEKFLPQSVEKKLLNDYHYFEQKDENLLVKEKYERMVKEYSQKFNI